MKIYQLKIELAGSEPLIWRRIQVSDELSFDDLHHLIQLLMGWDNDHLYDFKVNNTLILDFGPEIDNGQYPNKRDSIGTFLDEFLNLEKTKFTYTYDFGDHWEHVITLEKIFEPEEGKSYPVFIDGEMAGPPEDTGGIWRYNEMVEAFKDKNHIEHEDAKEWLGPKWKPELLNKKVILLGIQAFKRFFRELENELPDEEDPEFFEDEFTDIDTYESVEGIDSPKDILDDVIHKDEIEYEVDWHIEDEGSKIRETYNRLLSEGIDKERARALLIEVLAIEHFNELKLGFEVLESRYAYNLENLPQKPVEVATAEHAIEMIRLSRKGVPSAAVDFLQNDNSESTRQLLLNALQNYEEVADVEYLTEPAFWYLVAAEKHLCEELIYIVPNIAKGSYGSDLLLQQCQYIYGLLAKKYPDLAMDKALQVFNASIENYSSQVYFLNDVLFFCDKEKYKDQLIALFKDERLSWKGLLASHFADIQLTEAIPSIKEELIKAKKDEKYQSPFITNLADMEESIQLLENPNPSALSKPMCEVWEENWQERYDERDFYTEPNTIPWNMPSFINPNSSPSNKKSIFQGETLVKEKKPGRNEPCHCGSGKKYKKCCLQKDEALER